VLDDLLTHRRRRRGGQGNDDRPRTHGIDNPGQPQVVRPEVVGLLR
jgi:hypothetical protein